MSFNFIELKFLNLIFSKYGRQFFSEIFRECRGVESLSTYKFVGTFHLRKKVTELFSEIFWGTLNPRGDPEPAKV